MQQRAAEVMRDNMTSPRYTSGTAANAARNQFLKKVYDKCADDDQSARALWRFVTEQGGLRFVPSAVTVSASSTVSSTGTSTQQDSPASPNQAEADSIDSHQQHTKAKRPRTLGLKPKKRSPIPSSAPDESTNRKKKAVKQ
jgi:hypothetical protein